MPNSKQISQMNKSKAFYSRKYNKYFKSYESYLRYDEAQKRNYSKNAGERLEYKDGYLVDKKTGKRLNKPTAFYRQKYENASSKY